MRGLPCLVWKGKFSMVCALRNASIVMSIAGSTASSTLSPDRYQDYQAKDIPVVDKDGARVRVMAGEYSGVTGPIALRNQGMLLDVTLAKGASFAQPVSSAFSFDGIRCALRCCIVTCSVLECSVHPMCTCT